MAYESLHEPYKCKQLWWIFTYMYGKLKHENDKHFYNPCPFDYMHSNALTVVAETYNAVACYKMHPVFACWQC